MDDYEEQNMDREPESEGSGVTLMKLVTGLIEMVGLLIFLSIVAVIVLAILISLLLAVLSAMVDYMSCLLYTSPSPRDRQKSRMPSSA